MLNQYYWVNYFGRIFCLFIIGLTQYLLFNSLVADVYIYVAIILIALIVWNVIFIIMPKRRSGVLVSCVIESILSSTYIFVSKNPFGLLASFMIPTSTAIQFVDGYIKYALVAISCVFSIVGFSSIFSLISDPLFPTLMSYSVINILFSILLILTFVFMNRIINAFSVQINTYKDQSELLVSNIGELENKIYQYEKQIENLKNELEQERVAFNVEMEKVIKEYQTRKDEAYNQIKSLNSEMILKDKTIKELNQTLDNVMRDLEENRNLLQNMREILTYLTDNITNFQSLYKISENIIEIVSNYIPYDTLVIFTRDEINGVVDTFLVSGQNAEFYYSYKKIEVEEMYIQSFVHGRISFANRDEESVIRPFYPKEQFAVSVPIIVANKKIGMLYISYLSLDKYQEISEGFLWDLSRFIGIMLYTAIAYSKSVNRVIWDDVLSCYSAEFIWEFINNLSFNAKRYNEFFALVLLSCPEIFGKGLESLSEEDIKLIKQINLAIKSTIRESDLISFVGNGTIMVVLTKTDKEKVDLVCNRIKVIVDSKIKLLGYISDSSMVCSVYPYNDMAVSQLIELSIQRLAENVLQHKSEIEIIKV
ncbi:MAG: hypothetical protein ABDH21_03540 [bacterium]